ncbi:MAG: FMN-binding negative transcriptional regulator [Actinomycetota bacterium]
MYIPSSFREERLDVLHRLIRKNSFGTLVSHDGSGMTASHLPFLLREEPDANGVLLGHMARANTQWEAFASGAEALVMFQGPHAYVSPSWYATELSVPTWNYAVVHAYGTPRLIEDPASVRALLEATVAAYETSLPEPWTVDRLPDDFVEKLARAIVAFEIPISRIEGKFKLSQNRSEADRLGAASGLRKLGDALSLATAALMDAQER